MDLNAIGVSSMTSAFCRHSDAGRCLGVVVEREAAFGFRTRDGESGSMAATHEAFRIALAAHNVTERAPMLPGMMPITAFTGAYRALAGDAADVPAVVVLPGHV